MAMEKDKYPKKIHKAFHAHVYFDGVSKESARELCDLIATRWGLRVGMFHEKLVGPHPRWSCQVTFGKKDFDSFIPWLDEKRNDLTVLVHGLTGDDLKDHTDYAYWLGQSLPLNLDMFMPE